jgi:hypothetical protein
MVFTDAVPVADFLPLLSAHPATASPSATSSSVSASIFIASLIRRRLKPRLVGLNHVALQVDDLEEAVRFCTTLFQPTTVDRSEPAAAFLEMGDQFLALFERGSREEEPHFGLVVDDKEAARRELEEAGVEILPGTGLISAT